MAKNKLAYTGKTVYFRWNEGTDLFGRWIKSHVGSGVVKSVKARTERHEKPRRWPHPTEIVESTVFELVIETADKKPERFIVRDADEVWFEDGE